jgi:2'-5' RNA ligase
MQGTRQDTRYAIYFAPPPDTPLWRFGSDVLGYDAASEKETSDFSLTTYSPEMWRELTKRPRVYGFHATLKAPFRLHELDEAELKLAMSAFCATHAAFRLGPLAVTAIGSDGHGFVALTPTSDSAYLVQLERDVVVGFDHFRRPLNQKEYGSRRPDSLSARQRSHLDTYGYPFVLEDFRFHMTLTGAVADAPGVADMLADAMANSIGTADVQIDALCLFRQRAPNQPFVIIERFELCL